LALCSSNFNFFLLEREVLSNFGLNSKGKGLHIKVEKSKIIQKKKTTKMLGQPIKGVSINWFPGAAPKT